MNARKNMWIAGTGLLVAAAANAQGVYRLDPGSLYEHRECVAPFSQAWKLDGTFRLTPVENFWSDKTIRDYWVSDIRWSTGQVKIEGNGILRVRYLTGSEQLMELDLVIAGKSVHVAGGAHGDDGELIRIVIPLASQEDPVCYSTAIVINASRVPIDSTADVDASNLPTRADLDLPTATKAAIDSSRVPAPSKADFDNDGEVGTDADIAAFFACLAGNCCDTCGDVDFDGDGDAATDADIQSFFRVLAGAPR
jgi:hypothetical protein